LGGAAYDMSPDCGTLVGLMSENGSVDWATRVLESAMGYVTVSKLRVAANDDLYLAGFFDGNVSFGGSTFFSVDDYDMFLARFDSSGNHVSSDSYGGQEDESVHGLAVVGADDLLVFGRASAGFDLGTGSLVTEGTALFGWRTGSSAGYATNFGDGDVDEVTLGLGDHAFISGEADAMDLGDGLFGGPGLFASELDGSGTALWLREIPGGLWDAKLMPTPDGNAVLVAAYEGQLDAGTGALPPVGYREAGILVTKLATP
jgi:hypothetical protein